MIWITFCFIDDFLYSDKNVFGMRNFNTCSNVCKMGRCSCLQVVDNSVDNFFEP